MATNKSRKILALVGLEGLTRLGTEANYGTRPTTPAPGGSDAIWSFDDANPFQVDVAFVNREPIRASYTKAAGIPGRTLITYNPKTVLQGSNFNETDLAPYLVNMMRGCGMAVSSNAVAAGSQSWKLTPKSSDFDSLFADLYIDNIYAACTGLYGTFTMDGVAGNPMDVQFNYRGQFPALGLRSGGVSGAPAKPTATYPAGKRMYIERAGFSLAGSSTGLYVKSFRFDAGVVIEERPDCNSPYGFAGLLISNRAPKLSFVMEAAADVQTFNIINDMQNATLKAVSFQHVSGQEPDAAGNHSRFTFNAPTAQFRSTPMGESNGLRTYNCEMDLIGEDDLEYSLLFEERNAA